MTHNGNGKYSGYQINNDGTTDGTWILSGPGVAAGTVVSSLTEGAKAAILALTGKPQSVSGPVFWGVADRSKAKDTSGTPKVKGARKSRIPESVKLANEETALIAEDDKLYQTIREAKARREIIANRLADLPKLIEAAKAAEAAAAESAAKLAAEQRAKVAAAAAAALGKIKGALTGAAVAAVVADKADQIDTNDLDAMIAALQAAKARKAAAVSPD